MESFSNCENSQQVKEQFKGWLQTFHEQLSAKNKVLKSCLHVKKQRNKALNEKIENITNNSLDTTNLTINAVQSKVQSQLEVDLNRLKTKSEQLNKCNETIRTKVEEETKKMRKKFYEIITKDDLALKPYKEVEEAIKALNDKKDEYIRRQNDDTENFIKSLNERERYFLEIKQTITLLEPIEQEMRLTIQNSNKDLEKELKSLKLKHIEEATEESEESKELLLGISNMKSQLNIK